MDDWAMIYKGVGTGLVCLGHVFRDLDGRDWDFGGIRDWEALLCFQMA